MLPICTLQKGAGGGCRTQSKGCLSRSDVNRILSLGWVTSRWEGLGCVKTRWDRQGKGMSSGIIPSGLDGYPSAKGKILGGNITPALKWKRSFSPQGAAPGFPAPRDPRGSASILYQKCSQGKTLPLTQGGKKKKPHQRNPRPAGRCMLFHREKMTPSRRWIGRDACSQASCGTGPDLQLPSED